MTDQAAPRPDPRASSGAFHDLMTEIRACKKDHTCPDLTSCAYYFEPNAETAQQWQAEGVYRSGIDPRVVFVCESPGRQFAVPSAWPPSRCWSKTRQDERFRKARERYGFKNCYITNTVKCGPRTGGRHIEHELTSCRRFLVREIRLLRPLVVVAVGASAYRTLRRDVVHLLDSPPVIFEITHYSARRDVESRWKQEFAVLKRLLARLEARREPYVRTDPN